MIGQTALELYIFLILISILFGTWSLIYGFNKRKLFNIFSGILGLASASYLIALLISKFI